MKNDITITGQRMVKTNMRVGSVCPSNPFAVTSRVSAFLGALRSFTPFVLLSHRIHHGSAGIEYPRPVANQLRETHQDFGNLSTCRFTMGRPFNLYHLVRS
jgi:hypothetical protein